MSEGFMYLRALDHIQHLDETIAALRAELATLRERAEDSERQLNELREAVSPGRLGFSGESWWVGVAKRMRDKEARIYAAGQNNNDQNMIGELTDVLEESVDWFKHPFRAKGANEFAAKLLALIARARSLEPRAEKEEG